MKTKHIIILFFSLLIGSVANAQIDPSIFLFDEKPPIIYYVEENRYNAVLESIESGENVNEKDYNGSTPLFFVKSIEIAKLLIKKGADVNAKNNGGKTPLFYVRNLEIAKYLIKKGADVNAKNNGGETPLFYVRNLEIAKLLIENGADVNAKNNWGKTPLFWVEDVEIAKLLIENGADVNAKNNWGETPLFWVEDVEIAKLLIENGADVNSKNDNGETLLLQLDLNVEIAKLLMENGADVNAKNIRGETILYSAYYFRNFYESEYYFRNFYDLLIENGANIDYKIMNDNSLLYSLTSENNLKEIEYLLQHYQPTIHNCPEIGKLPIHAAIEGHALETFNFWLDYEGIPNEKYKYIDTLLLYEIKNFNEPFWVKALLLLGANPEYKEEDGKSAIDIAEFQDKKELLSILKNPNSIDFLFEFGLSKQIISNIQENKQNLFLLNENNYNLLHLSIAYNEKEIMQYVLQQDTVKALINLKTDLGETPILLATLYNRKEFIPILLSYGADANIPDLEGYTPYALAKVRKDSILMQLFQNFDSVQIQPRLLIPVTPKYANKLVFYNNCLVLNNFYSIYLWDIKNHKQLKQIPIDNIFNFDIINNSILSSNYWDTFTKTDFITGRQLKTKIKGKLIDVNTSENLVFTYIDNKIFVWNSETENIIHSYPIEKFYWLSARSSNFLAFSNNDTIIHVLDIKTGDTISVFEEHKNKLQTLKISPNEKVVVSIDQGKNVFIWNSADGTLIDSFQTSLYIDNGFQYVDINFSPSMEKLVIEDWKDAVIYNLKTKIIEKEWYFEKPIYRISFYENDSTIIYNTGNQIKIVSLTDNSELATFRGYSIPVMEVNFFVNDSVILFKSENKQKFFSLESTAFIDTISSFETKSNKYEIKTDSRSNIFSIIDTTTNQSIRTFTGHSDGVTSVAFSPNENLIVSGSEDKTLKLWNTETGECIRTFTGHSDDVTFAAFSANDSHIFSGSEDKTLKLWNTNTGECIQTFTGHSADVTAAAFSPNDSLIVSGSEDQTLKLWDMATGRAIHTFTGHTATVNSVAFHPSGKFIFSAGNDDMLKIWSVDSLCELATVVFLDSTDWVVVAPNGLFDASENAMDKMHYVYGLEVIEFTQLKDRYYEPHLLQKLLGYEEGEIRSPSQGINNLRLYPEIKLNPIHDGILELNIHIREGGQGKIEIAINGKVENIYPKTGDVSEDKLHKTVIYDFSKYQGFNNGENEISIRVFNEENLVASRWETINYNTEIAGTVTIPEFYAIVVGTSDYSGSEIDLNYAADDADEFSNALQLAANKLFGEEHVHITTLTTNGTPPAKHRIEAAVNEFQQLTENDNVTPENTYFLCFFSGHGTSFGGSEGDFYYLTPEAFNFNLADEAIRAERSISTEEMMSYFQKVSALKQVLILDACHSGQAIADLMAQRADISSNNIRRFESLRDKTGMFVLAGSAADAASYEATRYGQGLLTYSLLSGMAGQALVENQYVDVAKLFDFTGEQVPLLAKGLGGIQKPQIHRPSNGQSFLIGQLTSNELKNISVNKEKTILLRSMIHQDRPPIDFLGISEMVNTQLKTLSESGEAEFVFFQADKFEGSISITGIYKNKGTEIEVEIYIYQGATELATFTLKAATAEDLSKLIVQKTLETLRL